MLDEKIVQHILSQILQNTSTGLLQSFHTPKMYHLWLISLCEKNCITYQIFIGIIPTFSENFIQFNQVWFKPWT